MKTLRSLIIAALVTAFLFSANLSFALEPIPQESGFSGFIRPSVGYLNFKSNMVASFLGFDLSKKRRPTPWTTAPTLSPPPSSLLTVLPGIHLCQHPHPAVSGYGPDRSDPVRLQPADRCQAGHRQFWHFAGRYLVQRHPGQSVERPVRRR